MAILHQVSEHCRQQIVGGRYARSIRAENESEMNISLRDPLRPNQIRAENESEMNISLLGPLHPNPLTMVPALLSRWDLYLQCARNDLRTFSRSLGWEAGPLRVSRRSQRYCVTRKSGWGRTPFVNCLATPA